MAGAGARRSARTRRRQRRHHQTAARRPYDQFLIDIQHAETVADRVVLGFVSALQTMRRNPLIAGLMTAEPDVELVAELMTRLSASFLVTPSHVVDLDDDEQVRAVARRHLVPMLEPATPRH